MVPRRWSRKRSASAALVDVWDHKGLSAVIALTSFAGPVVYAAVVRVSNDPTLSLGRVLVEEVQQPAAGLALSAVVLLVYVAVIVPFRQRNAERIENDRLRLLVDRRPLFDLTVVPFELKGKSDFVEFRNEPLIPDSWIFSTYPFRITNKSTEPLDLDVSLSIPLLGDDRPLGDRDIQAWQTLGVFPLQGQAERPEQQWIIADLQSRWLKNPIHVEARSTTDEGRSLLFFYRPDEGLQQEQLDLDRQELVMRDNQTGFHWRLPVGTAFGLATDFTADQLEQYVTKRPVNLQ